MSKHSRIKENRQAKSQHIGRIDAWSCFSAYACVPFFTHTARVFGVISLEDWVLELRFSNLRVKFAKQEVMVSIIFITSPMLDLASPPFQLLEVPFAISLSTWPLIATIL